MASIFNGRCSFLQGFAAAPFIHKMKNFALLKPGDNGLQTSAFQLIWEIRHVCEIDDHDWLIFSSGMNGKTLL